MTYESEQQAHRAALKLRLHMVHYLNGLVELDRGAMHLMIETRFPCTQAMADDPHVKVAVVPSPTAYLPNMMRPMVGLLGVINGFLAKEAGPEYLLVARYSDDGALIGFAPADSQGNLVSPDTP